MRIAVLSGKGGTGKTTISCSLAASIGNCQYVDCDVEEPNGLFFLNPWITSQWPVMVLVPQVDDARCNGCGQCAKVCRFHALACVNGKVLTFPQLCHHCGACRIACPNEAIVEIDRAIGVIEADSDGHFMQGRLNIGEPSGVPIIRELKSRMRQDIPVIVDCSPGASCAVVQSIEGCDYCLLVTEPTPFGLHDLRIAVQVVRKMNIPFGVVINKAMAEDTSIQHYCGEQKIDVLMEMPFSREIAENYSNGILPVQRSEGWKNKFANLYEMVKRSRGV